VLRFDASGAPDSSFDGDGRAFVDILDESDYAEAVAIQPDGRIVVAGISNPSGRAPSVLRGASRRGRRGRALIVARDRVAA
jgi:Domain of unknown function (DUF5122) beta-propeller